ncbi:MAG TPA: hypothetical protein VGM18_14020 [Candidatus Sulfotelmatobacter sp.]|jgi:hypothetical protein
MSSGYFAQTKVPMSVIVIAGHDLVIGNCRQGDQKMAYKTIQTQTLTVAKTDSIKRGFVAAFVAFVAKKGHVTVAELQAKFTGRQFNGKKVTNERVVRYAYWCVANGVLKVAAKANAAKAGAR